MISTTGRMPRIPAPTAAPMIADSEIGVSNTRSPNAGGVPATRKGPARKPDVLAEDNDLRILVSAQPKGLVDRPDVGQLRAAGCRVRHTDAQAVRRIREWDLPRRSTAASISSPTWASSSVSALRVECFRAAPTARARAPAGLLPAGGSAADRGRSGRERCVMASMSEGPQRIAPVSMAVPTPARPWRRRCRPRTVGHAVAAARHTSGCDREHRGGRRQLRVAVVLDHVISGRRVTPAKLRASCTAP